MPNLYLYNNGGGERKKDKELWLADGMRLH
jgi:hypothetical protein